jgi:hypothetical protein
MKLLLSLKCTGLHLRHVQDRTAFPWVGPSKKSRLGICCYKKETGMYEVPGRTSKESI